jgi:thiamine-phosphate pyrophosphorylase
LKDSYRILDANVNRVCEGLRVVEDWLRFSANDDLLSVRVKRIRHAVRDSLHSLNDKLLAGRRADSDVGFKQSQKEAKTFATNELLPANFKRAQEGLRVIEEQLRQLGYSELARRTEANRFAVYTLEKETEGRRIFWDKKARLQTELYGITAYEYSNGRSNTDVVKAMLNAGIQLIQYREKERNIREKLRECDVIRQMTNEAKATFIVNDHPDLALMVGADGIHVGQDDLPVERIRRLVGSNMIIGLSTHSPVQAEAAMELPVDYIGVGPIFSTFTKKDVCAPVGLDYLAYAVKNVTLPFVAIGGIKEHNLREVVEKGARCAALVTEIVGAADIEAKVADLRRIFQEERLKHEH